MANLWPYVPMKGDAMTTDTTHFKINMPVDLMEKLKEAAVRESRSVTGQIVRMLRHQVETEARTQK